MGVGLRQSTSDDVVKPTERFTSIDIASVRATQGTSIATVATSGAPGYSTAVMHGTRCTRAFSHDALQTPGNMEVDMQRDTAHIHPLQRSAYSKAVVAELFAKMTVTKALRTDWFKCAASFRLRRSPAVSRYQSFGDYLLGRPD